jgi:hypothetical protein
MNTTLKKQSLHLFIDVKIPEKTIASINKVYVQEAIRILLQSDLEALAGDSPEDILQGLGFTHAHLLHPSHRHPLAAHARRCRQNRLNPGSASSRTLDQKN